MKGLKWISGIVAVCCIVLLAGTMQSCGEANTSTGMPQASAVVAPLSAEGTQAAAEEPQNTVAGKTMILDHAYDAETGTTYTFDANNPEDRFLMVPSKIRQGYLIQASVQKQKTAGREFTERFYYGGNGSFDASPVGTDEYVASDEKGNTLWFKEWKGAPLFDESKLMAPEKGASVANTQIICWTELECDNGSRCPFARPTCRFRDPCPNCIVVCRWVVHCSEYIDVIGIGI